jgi:hypothetical protein
MVTKNLLNKNHRCTGISDGKKEELIKNKISLRRFGSTQDIADAAMFIAKANYLHGHVRMLK